jgi:hypothetical protein
VARVKIDPLSPAATVLTRGGFLIRDTRHGPVAQAWPRPRGPAKTPYDFYKQKEFGNASHIAANPYYLDYLTAVQMVKGSTWVPRDFLVSCAYGRAYTIEPIGGPEWPNYRDMAPNPQYVLDLLGDTVGSIIYRSEDGWVLLDPGNVGQILTETTGGPIWADNTGPYVPPDVQAILDQLTPSSGDYATYDGTDWIAAPLPIEPGIQDLLDTISTATGAILYRSGTDWVALAPGSNGEVLSLTSGLPDWITAPWGSPLYPGTSANLTVGYTATAANAGTKSSGTFTPDPASGNLQRYTNGGAHTLAPPSVGSGDSAQIAIKVTNNSSAGAITTSGFTKKIGDAFTTTNGHKFLCVASIIDGDSLLTVTALQ